MVPRYVRVLMLLAVPAVYGGCNDYSFTEPERFFEVTPAFDGIDEGTTIQLAAVANGQPVEVTWSSDNSAVVSVTSTGLVSAVGRGAPTGIIARLVSDPTKSAASSITVNPLPGIGLTRAVPRSIGAVQGSFSLYRIFVPAGQSNLTITTSGGTGDVDIYVRRGAIPFGQIPPDSCTNDHEGNAETCTVQNPQTGTWFILAVAFETYAGVILTASYSP